MSGGRAGRHRLREYLHEDRLGSQGAAFVSKVCARSHLIGEVAWIWGGSHSRGIAASDPLASMGKLTNALPASFSHVKLLSSRVATGHPGHSTATTRLNGLIASVSRALSSPSSAAVIEGGMSTALAASARLAKRPSLLGDISKRCYSREGIVRWLKEGESSVVRLTNSGRQCLGPAQVLRRRRVIWRCNKLERADLSPRVSRQCFIAPSASTQFEKQHLASLRAKSQVLACGSYCRCCTLFGV
jgi:hypothetical protein